MEERNVCQSNIVKLDELIELVVISSNISGMVHNLADHDRANFGIGVREPGSGSELNHSVGAIGSERQTTHGHELSSNTRLKPTEGNRVFCGAEARLGAKTG